MTKVPAVGKEVDASALGTTLMHEHIFVLSAEINQNYPETWGDEDSRIQDAVRQLRALKANGIDSLVDVTVLGLGRCIPRIQRIAAQVELNILVATGIYICDELPPFFQFRNSGSPSDPPKIMIDMFVRDIQEGIAGTEVRAAVLKCATDIRGMSSGLKQTESLMLAAALVLGTLMILIPLVWALNDSGWGCAGICGVFFLLGLAPYFLGFIITLARRFEPNLLIMGGYRFLFPAVVLSSAGIVIDIIVGLLKKAGK